MSNEERLRRVFVAFHLTLGLALLWGGVHTVLDLGATDLHARLIGSIEAIGALAFLVPRTFRGGAALLLLTLLLAVVLHAARGEWRPDLLVYAAGVLLVAVHGPAYRPHHRGPQVGDVLPVQQNLPGGRLQQARHAFADGRLAATRFAHQAQDLARTDLEGDTVHRTDHGATPKEAARDVEVHREVTHFQGQRT